LNNAFTGGQPVSTEGGPKAWHLYSLVAIVGVCTFIIALTGYPNLMDNERRVGGYVLDAVQNGNWLIQRDTMGEVASKPPLLTWIAALVTLGFGEINRFALYLPSGLAAIGVAFALLAVGKRYFGWQTGLLGALMYLLSYAGDRQMMTARYDGLLAFPVTLAAVAAFRAWSLGKGWTWFWLAGALGTLAKGPIALVLGAGGLLAHFWERRTGHESRVRGSHWLGVLVFFVICGGWFLAAYADMGQPLIDKMLGRELASHATGAGRNEAMFLGFYEPPLTFLVDFAPWSLLACAGFWRAWRRPDIESEARRFERFLVCWFACGLLLFCIAAHQRGRLIFPLLPAAALLAARELAQWLRFWSTARLMKTASGFAIFVLSVFFLYHHFLLARSRRVQTTIGMRELAAKVRGTFGEQFPLVHVHTPFALQFYLNTGRPLTSFEHAAALLRETSAVYVAVSRLDELLAQFDTNPPVIHEISCWPAKGTPEVRIVSNRPSYDSSAPLATVLGPFLINMEGVNLVRTAGQELVLRSNRTAASISILNQSQTRQPVRIRLLAKAPDKGETVAARILAPGETW
jgi:4-amino-4-deoxy-L-arabinose transferase-like glycosyltransferase